MNKKNLSFDAQVMLEMKKILTRSFHIFTFGLWIIVLLATLFFVIVVRVEIDIVSSKEAIFNVAFLGGVILTIYAVMIGDFVSNKLKERRKRRK